MRDILISTECVADLSKELKEELNVEYIYYDLQTEEGMFRDNDEIDALNMIEYMSEGTKVVNSIALTAEEFAEYFEGLLKKHERIVHICISSDISESYKKSVEARKLLGDKGERIRIIDSRTLSSGIAMLVIEAAKLIERGDNLDTIEETLNRLTQYISTSFIAYNADYLYYNKKVSLRVKNICNALNLHPVLHSKNGELKLKTFYFGNYDKASARYIKSTLRHHNNIDDDHACLTYVGVNHKKLERIKSIIGTIILFDKLHLAQASATVSVNCGPQTFGVIYKRKAK